MFDETSRCIVDGSKGIYIGQDFALRFNMRQWGVSETDEKTLLDGPACPLTGNPNSGYWEAWWKVLNGARYFDSQGDEWTLEEDNGLFMRNLDAETDDDDLAMGAM